MILLITPFIFFQVVFSKNSVVSRHVFARLIHLDNLRASETPTSINQSESMPDCTTVCARDEACVAVMHHGDQCSIYRSSLSPSSVSLPGARSFIKQGDVNHYGAPCTSGTDCQGINSDCLDGICQCESGSMFSETSFHCTQYYQGCYYDDNSRMLPHAVLEVLGMTTELCIQHCRVANYVYAATQYTTQCFCGDVLPDGYPKKPENECSMPCGGNSAQICGGAWRNSVYLTHV